MAYREIIAARLRELRRLKGVADDRDISQREVADAIGVSTGSVGNWESGYSTPDCEKAMLLADYYGVSLDALAGRTQ